MAEPLLEVKNLRVHFPTEDGLVKAVDGVSFSLLPGETLGVVGESGSGKSVSFLTVMGLIDTKRAIIEGEIIFQGQDLLTLPPDEMRHRPRREDLDDLPGPDDVAASVLQGRRSDRRGRPGPPAGLEEGGARAGGRDAPPGRDPAPGRARRPVPARVLRRHASASDDRHGALAEPGPADRRRAHDGARRDGPGPDPRPDRPAEAGVQRGDRHHHARPRRGGRALRPHPGDVRRQDRRGGRPSRHLLRGAPPLHVGAPCVDPAPERQRRQGAAAARSGGSRPP